MKKRWFNRISLAAIGLIYSSIALAGEKAPDLAEQLDNAMRADGRIYVVVGVIVMVFIGLALYAFSIDRKASKLESLINERDDLS